jgi:hypothetical protein
LSDPLPVLLVAIGLGLVHLVAGRLTVTRIISRSSWLSFAGGTSVAFVFVHLLPELEVHQGILREAGMIIPLPFADRHAYLIALIGLTVFYGLESSTKKSRKRSCNTTGDDVSSPKMFWISIAAFACYNALIGYLLVSQIGRSLQNLLYFALAFALHFLVNDYGLHAHHRHLYARYGRWLLAVAVVTGALFGHVAQIKPSVLAVMISFLAGGIVLNVLKEELPNERESRFSAFASGAAIYAALLLAT